MAKKGIDIVKESNLSISHGMKLFWNRRREANAMTNFRYRRFQKQCENNYIYKRCAEQDSVYFIVPAVAEWRKALLRPKTNSYSLRLNRTDLDNAQKQTLIRYSPNRTTIIDRFGRFHSRWTKLEKSIKLKIFKNDLDVDIVSCHWTIFMMLASRLHDGTSRIEDELQGKDIFEYFQERGIGRAVAKDLVNKTIHGRSMKKLRKEVSALQTNNIEFPKMLAIIRALRYQMIEEWKNTVDALGFPITFRNPYIPDNYKRNKDNYERLMFSYELLFKIRLFYGIPGTHILLDMHDGCILAVADKRQKAINTVSNHIESRIEALNKEYGVKIEVKCKII